MRMDRLLQAKHFDSMRQTETQGNLQVFKDRGRGANAGEERQIFVERVYRSSRTLMRRIVPYGRSVGRSHARSFVTRSTYSGQGPTPQALLPLSLLSLPPLPPARSYRPTFLTTRHCVPPRWNPVYSLTLWIFRKRFAASRAHRASPPAPASSLFLRLFRVDREPRESCGKCH